MCIPPSIPNIDEILGIDSPACAAADVARWTAAWDCIAFVTVSAPATPITTATIIPVSSIHIKIESEQLKQLQLFCQSSTEQVLLRRQSPLWFCYFFPLLPAHYHASKHENKHINNKAGNRAKRHICLNVSFFFIFSLFSNLIRFYLNVCLEIVNYFIQIWNVVWAQLVVLQGFIYFILYVWIRCSFPPDRRIHWCSRIVLFVQWINYQQLYLPEEAIFFFKSGSAAGSIAANVVFSMLSK